MAKITDLLDALEESELALIDAMDMRVDEVKVGGLLREISRLLVLHDRKSGFRRLGSKARKETT